MICFNRNWLALIGLTLSPHEYPTDGGGIATSSLFSFGGGGNSGRDKAALKAEPEPRSLVLVGMSDRYGEAQKLGASVREMCLDDGTAGFRKPTRDEAIEIARMVEQTEHPLTERIVDALRSYATAAI